MMDAMWTRRALLAAGGACLAAGCTTRGVLPPSRGTDGDQTLDQSPSSHAPSFRPDALGAALRAQDQRAFVAQFAPGEASQALALRVWESWRALGVEQVGQHDEQLVVAWRPSSLGSATPVAGRASDPGPAPDPGWVLDAVAPRLANGLIARLDVAGEPAPLWAFGPITVATQGPAVVVGASPATGGSPEPGLAPTASTAAMARWGRAAEYASVRVRQALPALTWDGSLVVTLPPDAVTWRRVAGLEIGSAASTAAVTLGTAAGERRGACLIVGNLSVGEQLSASALRVLMVHEGVHAAVASPWSAAPLWLVEGLAEAVAQASDPDTLAANRAAVRARVARGRPTALPAEAELSGPQALTGYACAAVAVEAAFDRWGRPAVVRWIRDWRASGRPSEAELTAAYLEALPA